METNEKQPVDLPENAFRELKPGEEYKPILSPEKVYPEVNAWSVSWGIVMAVIFSAAAAFLGLKVGQVFEAAIPIAIIAVGLSGAAKRKNALGENVIIQSIGACSGVIVAGAIFTLPALYILQAKYPELTVNFMEVFMSSLLGGILGILFLIPFRKYFVSDMHGKYPFPEATATTQVLVSGEKAGNQAKPLILAGLVGGLYDFCLSTFGWWSEVLTTRILPWGTEIANHAKMVFKVNTGAAVLGLGYIVGLKYCLIICSGSLFVWFVIIPLLGSIPGSELAAAAPEQIFTDYGRYIGIGGIAMAGVIGIIRSWGIIKGAVGLATKEFSGKNKGAIEDQAPRTQRDLSMKFIISAAVFALIITFLFFYLGVINNFMQATVAFLVVAGISFLFTTVAANAIAIVGTNPVSGMTLMTLILASVILVADGGADHRRRGLHGALDGRRIHYRLENRLLDRLYSSQTRDLEIPRYTRLCRNRRRCYPHSEQIVRILRGKRFGSTSGQCYGGSYRAPHDGTRRTVDALWNRCYSCRSADMAECPGFGVRFGYVHSVGTKYTFGHRRAYQLVCRQPFKRYRSEQSPFG